MKKPGKPKPKPKRRARPQALTPKPAERRSTLARSGPVAVAASRNAKSFALPRTFAPQHEERTRIALLLLPFLIVAVSLWMAQSRRIALPQLPEIASKPPGVEQVAISPPLPAPQLPTARPPAANPAVPVPPPAPAAIEPVAAPIQFPPPVPVVEPAITARTAAPEVMPEVITAPLPAFARFPPPAANLVPDAVNPPEVATRIEPAAPQQTAALDVRPLAAPVLPALPPAPHAPPADAAPVPTEAPFCSPSPAVLASFNTAGRLARHRPAPRLTGVDADTFGQRLAAAAVAQTRDLVIYTARYQSMAYPMGDVLSLHGACIDVVIRAYRTVGIDLQEEVQLARPSRGDTNIDHRRTENMRRFLEKHGTSLPISEFPEDYKPGDIVTYHRPFSRVSTSHIAIVSDVLAPTGRPMIVHNRGYGPQLEDALFVDRITGHYRYMGKPPANTSNASTPAGNVVRTGYRAATPVAAQTSAKTTR